MSRAFVFSHDDRSFCLYKKESCMYADESGKCVLTKCRRYPDEVVFTAQKTDFDEDFDEDFEEDFDEDE